MKKEKPTHSTDASSSQKYTIPIVTEKEVRIRIIKDFLIFILPILLLLVIFRFFFMIGLVPSESMYPLMTTNSAIIANRIAYDFTEPSRGDVIIFRNGSSYMTKRIIGIPEDKVSIQNGIIYINEQPVTESYLSPDVHTLPLNGRNYFEVPDSSYFVLGDNREHSYDSRAWDDPYVPIDHIAGKVLCVFSLHPVSYRGVTEIAIEPIHSGAPAYDPDNIVTEATGTAAGTDSLTPDPNSAATLPVETIAPEDVTEPVTEEETSEETSEEASGETAAAEESSADSETDSTAETE